MSTQAEDFGQDIYDAAFEECAYAEILEGASDIAANLAKKGYARRKTLHSLNDVDDLRDGAVVLEHFGEVYQKFGVYWRSPASDRLYASHEMARPVTVLYERQSA